MTSNCRSPLASLLPASGTIVFSAILETHQFDTRFRDDQAVVFVLGTDEAGYGPNLGPLCVASTAWQLPDDAAADGLYDCLGDVVCTERADDDCRLAIADSKSLYKSGGSLEPLERGVLVALAALN